MTDDTDINGERKLPRQHDGNWYILVVGLPRPESSLSLAPGLSLRPLSASLTVFDLAAAGAAGFKEWAVLEPVAQACTCEIESAKDAAVTPGYDTLNRAWLISTLLVLRGYTKHACVAYSAYSWDRIAGHQKRTAGVFQQQMAEEGLDAAVHRSKRELPPFMGGLLDFHLLLWVDQDSRVDPLSAEDMQWTRAHFDTFNRLPGESESFKLALQTAEAWRYAKDPRSAVALLWSGIEAIFGISSELVYRLSLLSASLLEPPGDRRKARFIAVKNLYGLRSKIVHGEPLSDEKILSAMGDSYQLLRQLLLLAIDKGSPLSNDDFDKAIFGP